MQTQRSRYFSATECFREIIRKEKVYNIISSKSNTNFVVDMSVIERIDVWKLL